MGGFGAVGLLIVGFKHAYGIFVNYVDGTYVNHGYVYGGVYVNNPVI
jgi:hypothetical protein